MTRQYTQLIIILLSLVLTRSLVFSQDIVGGKNVEEGTYPFMVGIIESDENNLLKAIECGATVIADRWVMTAAHCLTRYDENGRIIHTTGPEEIEVLIGTYDLEHPVQGFKRLKVERIYINPSYERLFFDLPDGSTASIPDNDIALLRLEESLLVPPVQLPQFDDNSWEIDGLPVRVMGWGMENTQKYTRSKSLKEVTIELIDRDICREYNFYDELVTNSMLCAGLSDPGQKPAGGAQGDSGGPLLVQTTDGWLQLGIMSWGLAYTEYQKPGVYQKVSRHLQWIDDIMSTTSTSEVLTGIEVLRVGKELRILSQEDHGQAALIIYTTDGRLVSNSTLNLWSGISKSQPLPSDTRNYIYYLRSPRGYVSGVR
ncbi:MAG: serine protease [Saprospiraceae bacterium]|nr:serine protease [Saprospiraceae bacterium]